MPRKGLQELLGRDPSYQGAFGQGDARARNDAAPEPHAGPGVPTDGREPFSGRARDGQEGDVARAVQANSAERVVVAVNTRPLAGQVERIRASGLPIRDLMKAAWRQATTGLTLEATYVPPPRAHCAPGAAYRFSTTWTIEAEPLATLAEEHDPLGVRGSWALIRGQVEPAVWTALDDVLARMAERSQRLGPGPERQGLSN